MGIVINKIAFQNYRQYGTGTITFNTSGKSTLSIFIAKNGTGKTTILNAITWCLYGKELHLSDKNKALPIITSVVNENAKIDDSIPVAVTLTISDEDNVIEFKRLQKFKITKNSENKHAIPGNAEFTVTTTELGTFANTKIKTNADADIIVKQYFDEAIFKFYFFDGEKLRDFFTATQANSIKQSIFNISQITLLENSCSHLKKLKSDKTKILAKNSPNIAELTKEYEYQKKAKSTAVDTLNINKEQIKNMSKELEKFDDILRGYEPVKKLQNERDELYKKLNKAKNDAQDFKNARTAFIRKYTVILTLYPRIQKTLSIITEKEASGELPPAIDKDLIKKILEHPDQHCPICNSSIDETALEHIQKLLKKFSVSSITSNYLKEIKGSLEDSIDEVTKFKSRLDELNQNEMDIKSRIDSIENRLSEITAALSNFENIGEQVNVSDIEQKRSNIMNKMSVSNQAIGAAKITIENCNKEMKIIDDKIRTAMKKINEQGDLIKQTAVIDMLYNNFIRIKTSIMDDMKKEIEKTTWDYFDRMIWKKNTFGSLKISDDYNIAVYNKENVEMTGSLSATEQMALAYAFTLAIHKASGKNCPLVIDSPLGRVSDKNRQNMAEALKEVSNTKQIIMLFTPDEYSEEVKTVYNNAAIVRELTLSEDENYVEGIEH